MDRTERFYKIRDMLQARGVVPLQDFTASLEISVATFKRDLEQLRDRFGMTIIWNREKRGYQLDPQSPNRELPGLWFNSAETHALLAFHHFLENLEPGLLTPHIQPLQERIRKLLEKDDHSFEEIARRLRVLPLAARRIESPCFQTIAHALLVRRRLQLTHYHRGRNEETEREVSPQRLIHYRDNWYLDAWDHGKGALRTFAVDSLRRATLLEAKARNVPDKTLNAELGSSYGIFAGRKTQTAVLRFTPARARWVANEQWHPKQETRWLEDGGFELCIPYSDPRELVMDILKYGSDVEVTAPDALRAQIIEQLQKALSQYNDLPAG